MSYSPLPNMSDFSDEDFDKYLPTKLKSLSSSQWTSISVLKEIAKNLDKYSIQEIYDLGSGVGKFCIISSLLAQTSVIGIEKRPDLLQISEELKRKFGAKNTKFILGDFLDLDFSNIGAVYCFNPLYETMSNKHNIDATQKKSALLFIQNIIQLKTKFLEMKKGSKIITYHGFGGIMPKEFQKLERIQLELGDMEIWERSI